MVRPVNVGRYFLGVVMYILLVYGFGGGWMGGLDEEEGEKLYNGFR